MLGAEHPKTLTARHNLAVWTGQARDAVAALLPLTVLLPIVERVRGIEHPDTRPPGPTSPAGRGRRREGAGWWVMVLHLPIVR
ncbi:hypothetical protein HD597_005350 [Nonomuraea thailandensis]|uniref:Tetratricopeptide repeat protein n=1 Tax=Nonomuraea thailandensis TaxID=1188745 RepID=A0A9X2K3N0_9ACTN|nr:hypothetical protein [Nonomuraea thailandensis]